MKPEFVNRESRRDRPVLIAMAWLPGSGKSTLSRALAARIGALRWDKDELRHLLFPPQTVAHDTALNDFCMELLYAAILHALATKTPRVSAVILDGRPYAGQAQRDRVREVALEAGAELMFVVCSAPLDVLHERILGDRHPAPDRNPELLKRLAAGMQPFGDEAVIIETASATPEEGVLQCLRELAARGWRPAAA
jgi:predicted kinase